MGHIKEPKGVDFLIESKPLTDEERKKISAFIKARKKELKERTAEINPRKRKKSIDNPSLQ